MDLFIASILLLLLLFYISVTRSGVCVVSTGTVMAALFTVTLADAGGSDDVGGICAFNCQFV